MLGVQGPVGAQESTGTVGGPAVKAKVARHFAGQPWMEAVELRSAAKAWAPVFSELLAASTLGLAQLPGACRTAAHGPRANGSAWVDSGVSWLPRGCLGHPDGSLWLAFR